MDDQGVAKSSSVHVEARLQLASDKIKPGPQRHTHISSLYNLRSNGDSGTHDLGVQLNKTGLGRSDVALFQRVDCRTDNIMSQQDGADREKKLTTATSNVV